MAQRMIAASAAGERTISSLTEAALDWEGAEDENVMRMRFSANQRGAHFRRNNLQRAGAGRRGRSQSSFSRSGILAGQRR